MQCLGPSSRGNVGTQELDVTLANLKAMKIDSTDAHGTVT